MHLRFPLTDPIPVAVDERPAVLLRPRHRIVPYIDHAGQLKLFEDWCRKGNRKEAGRLIHAIGGTGKTRLAIELCALLHKDKWLTGFAESKGAPPDKRAREEFRASLHADLRPALLVVDRAEGRSDDVTWLAECLAHRTSEHGVPGRLLLLSRSAGEWWKALFHEDSDDVWTVFGSYSSAAHPLSMELNGDDRVQHFLQAIESFSDTLNRLAPGKCNTALPAQRQLDEVHHGVDCETLLAIHMHALLHLVGPPDFPNMTAPALLDAILVMERRYWRDVLDPAFYESRRMHRMVSQVTLVDGVESRQSATELIKGDAQFRIETAADLDRRLNILREHYGTGTNGVMPLEPDLLGEHYVAEEAEWPLIDACIAWANGSDEKQRAIISILNRATSGQHGTQVQHSAFGLLTDLVKNRGGELVEQLLSVALSENRGNIRSILSGHLKNAIPVSSLEAAHTLVAGHVVDKNEIKELHKRMEDIARQYPYFDDYINIRMAEEEEIAQIFCNGAVVLVGDGKLVEAGRVAKETHRMFHKLVSQLPEQYAVSAADALKRLASAFDAVPGWKKQADEWLGESDDLLRRYGKRVKEAPVVPKHRDTPPGDGVPLG
jgi:hypothetical protein